MVKNLLNQLSVIHIFAPAFVQVDGKDFGNVVADKLTTYGDQWKGINLADGQDGLYNKDKAKAQLEKAKAELQKTAFNSPIHIDVPVIQNCNKYSYTYAIIETNGRRNSW